MQKIFNDTRLLDKAARDNYGLTEDIMMENAAAALEAQGRAHFFSPDGKYINRPTVLILAGGGNNGADGYALARRIVCHDLCVTVCQVYQPKSAMCILQADRAKKAGVIFINPYDLDDFIERASFDLTVVYDCIFGSGFHGTLDALAYAVIASANKIDGAYKIACDIPTGVSSGDCSQGQKSAAFAADATVTMGALKLALYSDAAKDACGQIVVADLGISRSNFESAQLPCALLLEEADARLPLRDKKQNSNKGTYGHTAVFAGTKPGAAVIAGHAALKFGSGLVTLVAQAAQKIQFENVSDFELMVSEDVPQNATALVAGPGLGRATDSAVFDILRNTERPLVLDADIFYWPQIKDLLAAKKNVVLTPHPKEFAELLKNVGLGNYSTQQVVVECLELAKKFCAAFPGVTLLLKGANVLIASQLEQESQTRVYINPLGTSALAKGGSGDVLAGMTGALLAQGYTPLEAAVTASIKHASASHAFDGKDYALTPFGLIGEI